MKKVRTDRNIYKIIKSHSTDSANVALNEASEQRLEEVCSILKELNVNTLPAMLVDAQLQKVEYRWYHTGVRTRTLWKNIYMTIKSFSDDQSIQETDLVQNHEFGSDHYNIYKVKAFKR